MSSDWSVNTNRRLHFARLQLDAWDQADDLEAPAFRDGFILQLQLAWRSMLAEILGSYGITVATLPDFSQAQELMATKVQSSSELQQVESMLKQSWLKQLDDSWLKLFVPYQADSQNTENGDLIQMVSLGDQSLNNTALTPEAGRECINRLKNLVGHFRNFNLEW